jgi:uncharacterized membrane protein
MRPSPILAANIWEMMHGGSTHLPIALMLISAVFDGLGSVIRSDRLREQFHATGLFTLIAATLGAFPAVLSGLVLARWDIGGTGPLFWLHVFIWPSFALLLGLSVWRLIVRSRRSGAGLLVYLAFAVLAGLLVSATGFWGGEILLGGS